MAEPTATYRVERSIDIDAPPEEVFPHLDDFRAWRAWSPWEDIDPKLWRGYEGPESGVRARYEWAGNRKAGTGRMEILETDPPRSLDIQLDFIKPFKARSRATFTLEPRPSGSHVTWAIVGPKTFTTRLMGLFMSMDKAIGPDFEKGLARLKAIAEG